MTFAPKKETETQIMRSILDYLAYRHIFSWRNNSGMAMLKGKGGGMRPVFFGAVGSPDIIAIYCGKVYGLEVKSATGKQSENQKTFQEGMEKAGGRYFIVRSIADVTAIGL